MLTQEDLRKVMTTGGELVQNLPLRQKLGFFDVIERPRRMQQIGDPLPVGLPGRRANRPAEAVERNYRSRHAWLRKRANQGTAYAQFPAMSLLLLLITW